MCLLWAFDLPAAARRNLYLDRRAATEGIREVRLTINAFRATTQPRPREPIPH
jgi:hypothetical protein